MGDSIIFDSGPLISLSTNNLLWVLGHLKEKFEGEFFITNAVKRECVNRPLETKKFKFEALQLLRQIEKENLKIYNGDFHDEILKYLDIVNNVFFGHDNPIKIVHYAEMEVLIAALKAGSNKVVIDERTTRLLIENPMKIKDRLEKKLHTKIDVDKNNLDILKKKFGNMKVLRSTELVIIAYEIGLLNEYVIKEVKNSREELLEGVLWGLKLKGCSIREDEISEMVKIEKKIKT
ncbi:hypothetical protein C0585_05530 [Candidatus Woesearchaeota archaeon]|nr:MAG: hypothetical protein C0585_05530 [Candidatus Woesearchaeota archaeon]